jgi:hypothetical protein
MSQIGWVAWAMEKPSENSLSLKVVDHPTKNSNYIDERLKRLIIELRNSDNDYTYQLLESIGEYISECEDHPFLDQCFFRLEEALLWYERWSELYDCKKPEKIE